MSVNVFQILKVFGLFEEAEFDVKTFSCDITICTNSEIHDFWPFLAELFQQLGGEGICEIDLQRFNQYAFDF